jgi:hypothetical protein
VQLGASLAAVLALAGVAAWLKLGGGAIDSETDAIAAAEADVTGFRGQRATIDRDGRAAVVEGADGSIVVLKVAGARLASRHLPATAPDRREGALVIDTGDRWFGTVTIDPR